MVYRLHRHVPSFVSVYRLIVFFFFQAEDGIRDLTVTGVQTCALPISAGLAGRQLEMHLGPGRAPRPARPPPHDSGTTLRRDDPLSRGHPVPGRRRGPGTTGSGAADSCDSAAGDSRRDRRGASGAPPPPPSPAGPPARRPVPPPAPGPYRPSLPA